MDWQARFERETPQIEEVLVFLRRRHRMTTEAWEDFRSWAWVRLAESDYEVLRKFEGRSTLEAYLSVALHRWFYDFQRHKWGKWRPSAVARALGPDAILLESYLHRGHSRHEAIQMVKINHQSPRRETELADIADRLPGRERPELLAEEWLDRLPSSEATPEERMSAAEAETLRGRALDALRMVLATLPTEERVILKMKFEQGLRINEIARAIGRRPGQFYKRFERLRRHIRALLERNGIDADLLERAFPHVEWRT